MEKNNRTGNKFTTGGKTADNASEDIPAANAAGAVEAAAEGQLQSEQQAVIGRHLQALYDEIVKQELPQKLKDLLATLDRLPSEKEK